MSRHRLDPAEPTGLGPRIDAFCKLSAAASRSIDARYAAGGHPPGTPAKVAAADARTTLDDRRAVHTMAAGYLPHQMRRDGLRGREDTP